MTTELVATISGIAPRVEEPCRDPALRYLASLPSRGSRTTQASALRTVAKIFGREITELPWTEVAENMPQLRAYLAERRAPSTANRYLSAVREVLREARQLGLVSAELLEIALRVKSVRGSRVPPGRALSPAELRRLFQGTRQDPRRRRGARDAAIVALLFGGGLRRFEVAGLDREDYDGRSVRVLGKGNKERQVPLPPGALRALDAWLEVRGAHPGPLVDRLLGAPGRRIHPDSIALALERLVGNTGLAKALTHDGRRTMATYLLDEVCQPLGVVQELLGHASAAQTAKYRRGDVRRREAAMELVPVPFT